MPVFVTNSPANTSEYTLSPSSEDLACVPLDYPVFKSHYGARGKLRMVRLGGGMIGSPCEVTAVGLSQQGTDNEKEVKIPGERGERMDCLLRAEKIHGDFSIQNSQPHV